MQKMIKIEKNWSKTQIAKPCGKNESKLVKIGKKLVSVKANLKKPNSFQHPVGLK